MLHTLVFKSVHNHQPIAQIYDQPFKQLYSYLGIGTPPPMGWQSITTQALLIIVGTTGVGKNTTTEALLTEGLKFTLLPNRRDLSTQLVIGAIAQAEGKQVESLGRIERFTYAKRFRQQFSGGMSYVLRYLYLDPKQTKSLLIFDGLRGKEEVRYAATALPNAKFALLEAPDYVRLQRLLTRNDPFDQAVQSPNPSKISEAAIDDALASFKVLGVPEAGMLFSPSEEQELLSLVRNGMVSSTDLQDKLRIIVEERRNYDPEATRLTLEAIAPERTLTIDTTISTPKQSAQAIVAFI